MSAYADSKHGNKHDKSSSPANMLESHKQIKSVNMKNHYCSINAATSPEKQVSKHDKHCCSINAANSPENIP